MKNLKVNEKAIKNLRANLIKRSALVTLTSTLVLTGLTGCDEKELSNSAMSADSYDKINSNDYNRSFGEDIISGIVQELKVPGEEFGLIVEYDCLLEDEEEWTVTGNKNLYMRVYTKGLSSDKKVYMDNIHIDTTIMATIKQFDGILQDTMDDRIHNSLMLGFPISDDTYYYGVNAIEGQNDNFIQGFIHGCQGYSNGSVEEKRFLESDYLSKGVFANKITSVVGLLIQDNEHEVPYGVDVLSTLMVDFCNKVLFVKDGKKYYKIYEIDDEGNVEVIEEEYGKTKVLNR